MTLLIGECEHLWEPIKMKSRRKILEQCRYCGAVRKIKKDGD